MKRADVSLVTSLYKAEPFLTAYSAAVQDLGKQLHGTGLEIEIVLLPNDTSAGERTLIDKLQAAVERMSPAVRLQVIPTRLESIYAAWNRGLRAATGGVIGFWGVDDLRYAGAVSEACRLMAAGWDIVDFPVIVRIERGRVLGYARQPIVRAVSVESYPAHHISPFFLVTRDCFDRYGPFDEFFRINGDMEWTARALSSGARKTYGAQCGGQFHLHGGNLSANRPDMNVEINLIHLRYGNWDDLRIAEPERMRRAWANWPGARSVTLPEEIQDLCWGEQANRRWRPQRWRQPLESYLHGPLRSMRDRVVAYLGPK